MTEKELRSLSKIQMLNILRQQENEIEQLTSQRKELERKLEERQLQVDEAGSLAEASVMVSGVLQAAQNAADVYLENIRAVEAERSAQVARLEREAQEKAKEMYKESEEKHEEMMARLRKLVSGMRYIFEWQMTQLTKMSDDFDNKLKRSDIAELIKEEEAQEQEV